MRQQRRHQAAACGLFVALTFFSLPLCGSAQDEDQPALLGDVAKHVLIDPSTYVPAILGYDATYRDWQTSQPFFQHGFNELNPRFTVSGLPNDTPVSHRVGNRRILTDALFVLQTSAVNNAAAYAIDRLLTRRYPEHRTLWRTLGWVERVGYASYMAYALSAQHYRQAQWNEQTARQQGW